MATAPGHRMEPSSGMGPRKTMIIMVTVVGCVAILWPKVFYPMMVGNGQGKSVIKDHRGAGCCGGIVLDQEMFANASINFGSQQPHRREHQRQQEPQSHDQQPNLFRKRSYVPFVEIDSIRQERPPHLRPEAMHPAMRERGRAIPHAGSIHGGERPPSTPRIVEGRPGPIPGMRPPMGAGSHQATKSANSMGFIMPLYTIGIVSFFIYTIMKLIFKKSPATPYTEVKPDPAFRSEVFTTEQHIKRPDDGTTKLGQSAANGELAAPAAVNGAAVAPVESQHAPSQVQAELTIDYEQLSRQQKEEATVPVGPTAEQTPEAADRPAEEGSAEEQPPHDPTTEKVVDGIVVQKVVSFEECSAPATGLPVESPADAVEEVVEVIERTVVSKQEQGVTSQTVGAEEELPVDVIVEELVTEQHAAIFLPNEPVETVERSMEKEPVEQVVEEAIEERLVVAQSAPSAIDASEPHCLPATALSTEAGAQVAEVEEVIEEIEEVPAETVVEEVTIENNASAPSVDAAIPVAPEGAVEEPIIVQTVIEEIIIEQKSSAQTAEAVPSVEKLVSTDEEVIKEIPVESVVEEVTQVQQVSLVNGANTVTSEDNVEEWKEKTIAEVTPVAVEDAEAIPSVKEDVEVPVDEEIVNEATHLEPEAIPSVKEDVEVPVVAEIVNEATHLEPKLVQVTESEQSISVECVEAVPEAALPAEPATESDVVQTATETPQEPQAVIETVQVVQVTEVNVSKDASAEEVPAVEVAPTADLESLRIVEELADASIEESDPKKVDAEEPIASQSELTVEPTNVAETETRDHPETVELASEKTVENEQLTTAEDVCDSGAEPQVTTVTMTVLDAGTSTLVCDVAQNIAITAERLVQEVLEKAEEIVVAGQEQEPAPELPSYDPATQKLVDGIVIERFEPVEEAVKEESAVEVEPVRAVPVAEDDAAELDEVSEDTSVSVASVIENQQSVAAAVEETIPESLITTELMSTSTSSEPVFVEGAEEDQRPTVTAETVVEEIEPVAGNLSGAVAAEDAAEAGPEGVLIEEVHDENVIVDQAEGKVIEEHIVPITVESGSASGSTTITEEQEENLPPPSSGEPEVIVESPRISKTDSNLPSPLVTVVPVMGAIDEQLESTETDTTVVVPSPETLAHVSKEALVERTLSEAAAVVNEIESIVDHIITEKLIHSGAAPEESESKAPPRLATSAALVVEANGPKVHGGMTATPAASSDSAPQADTNGLPLITADTNRVESSMGDTNPTPRPASDSPLPLTGSPATGPPSSAQAFPVPEPRDGPSASPLPSASPAPSAHDAPPPAPHAGSETHTSTNLHTADPAAVVDANNTSITSSITSSIIREQCSSSSEVTVRSVQTVAAATGGIGSGHTPGQVPTGGVSSTVTNPKFLTLNLANYSTSDSSGNNSKSSASSSIANRVPAGAAAASAGPGSSLPLLAGPSDGTGQLMELELLRKKLDETERAMTKIIANMGSIPKGQESNVSADETELAAEEPTTKESASDEPAKVTNGYAIQPADGAGSEPSEVPATDESSSSSAAATPEKRSKKRDTSTERGTMKVMAMEVTAQRENGKRLSRPTTPLLPMGHPEGASATVEEKETRSIVLDGRLPHDSKILVADSATAVEKMEPENSEEEDDAPVILSGKMTLSLINMDFIEKDATGTVAVGEIVTELHKPVEELTTAPTKTGD